MKLAEHTLVVSRRRDVARRARWEAQAEAAGVEGWSYFDAIDAAGMRLETRQHSAHGRQGRSSPEPLLPGEVGCALSHQAIWRAAWALGLPEVLVLEDDVEIAWPHQAENDWGSFLAELPDDWLAVQACGDVVEGAEPDEEVSARVARVHAAYGTRALLLRRGALEVLLRGPEADRMTEPADWLLWPLYATKRVYAPREAIFRHANLPGIGG